MVSCQALPRATDLTFLTSLISQASYCARMGWVGTRQCRYSVGHYSSYSLSTYYFQLRTLLVSVVSHSLGTIILYQIYAEKQLVIWESFFPNMTWLAGAS